MASASHFASPTVAADEPYEAGIARTGRVPTRSNMHDFFNALIFLHFPRAKAQLNRLQSAAIARDGVRAVRGSVRDAATLIDENAVLVVTDRADIVESLRDHDWPCLFQSRRAQHGRQKSMWSLSAMRCCRSWCIRTKPITAHALACRASGAVRQLHDVDRWMAAALDEQLSSGHLMPLPVLGIPGWCDAKREPGFLLRPRGVPSG